MTRFPYGSKKLDTVYSLLCKEITLGEQIQIFGTCGWKRIIKKYGEEEAVNMVTLYLNRKKENVA